jgi:hypothetical protein
MTKVPLSEKAILILVALVVGAATPLSAQWLKYRDPAVPRTADGKADLSAPTPKTPDGKPDLSGVWLHEITTVEEMRRLFPGPLIEEAIKTGGPGMEIGTQHKYGFNILVDFKPEDSPIRPEVEKMVMERLTNPRAEDQCDASGGVPFGFPLQGLLSEPIKIVQAPHVTMVLYEAGNNFRQIYTDGRKLPADVNLPAYLGYSAGRWDGDTFIVETAGFNDKTMLDGIGHPHSDQLRVIERFRRRNFGHLDVEMTFDDPKNFTRPFTVRIPHTLLADADIFEMFHENEKDCAHIGKKK